MKDIYNIHIIHVVQVENLACMAYFHAPYISMDRWSYIIWDMFRSENAWWISIHCGYLWTDVDIFSGIGLRTSMHGGYSCTLDIQTPWIFRIFMDRWRYIIWDSL
jgi:hypothetical protein